MGSTMVSMSSRKSRHAHERRRLAQVINVLPHLSSSSLAVYCLWTCKISTAVSLEPSNGYNAHIFSLSACRVRQDCIVTTYLEEAVSSGRGPMDIHPGLCGHPPGESLHMKRLDQRIDRTSTYHRCIVNSHGGILTRDISICHSGRTTVLPLRPRKWNRVNSSKAAAILQAVSCNMTALLVYPFQDRTITQQNTTEHNNAE